MTRSEVQALERAKAACAYDGLAYNILDGLIRAAKREHAAEDRYHDEAEADAYPTNLEHAA